MTNVEQIRRGFPWAEPLQGNDLEVEFVGSDVQITGRFPSYEAKESQCDLLRQYEKSPKLIAIGQQRTGSQSPEVAFANADTDEKLIAFVRKFGPVVAKSVEDTAMIPDKELGEPRSPRRLIARQDMEELRKEQITYRAALDLVIQVDQLNYPSVSAQKLLRPIGAKIRAEWNRPKANYDPGQLDQVMKIIAEGFAQQLNQPYQSNVSARDILKVIAANIEAILNVPSDASPQRLMKIITGSIENHLDLPIRDYFSVQKLIRAIATSIKDWPSQWEREKSLNGAKPRWKLSNESLKRIESLSQLPRDLFSDDFVDGRIVICELLNSFPSTVFPNPVEMHSSIKYGIRPLLYSILRSQFINPRGFGFCGNRECRNFFTIERFGQEFCSSECSLQHRQRIYWQQQGKKLREKRIARAKKMRKQAAKQAKVIGQGKTEQALQ